MTCISVPDRTDKDWLFWADKDSAQLINPDNDKFDFTKDNGLYKLNKDQTTHKSIPNRLISKTDPDVDYLTQAWASKSKDKKTYKEREAVWQTVDHDDDVLIHDGYAWPDVGAWIV